MRTNVYATDVSVAIWYSLVSFKYVIFIIKYFPHGVDFGLFSGPPFTVRTRMLLFVCDSEHHRAPLIIRQLCIEITPAMKRYLAVGRW